MICTGEKHPSLSPWLLFTWQSTNISVFSSCLSLLSKSGQNGFLSTFLWNLMSCKQTNWTVFHHVFFSCTIPSDQLFGGPLVLFHNSILLISLPMVLDITISLSLLLSVNVSSFPVVSQAFDREEEWSSTKLRTWGLGRRPVGSLQAEGPGFRPPPPPPSTPVKTVVKHVCTPALEFSDWSVWSICLNQQADWQTLS